jgi:hypothetical protein
MDGRIMVHDTNMRHVADAERIEARIALFVTALSILLAGSLLTARWGLPTNLASVVLTFAIGLWPVLGPVALCGYIKIAGLSSACDGVLSVVLLLLPFAVVKLGLIGEVTIYCGAAWFAWIAWQRADTPWSTRTAGALLLVLSLAALFIIQIGGTKYVNFFADQLALFGRTDGDVFGHGAITNSLRYFGVPSMGIDGIRQLHYHVGVNILAAALAKARDLDAIFAIVLVKVLVLTPVLVRIVASAAHLFCQSLAATVGTLRLLGWVLGIVALLPLSNVGNARLASESMLLGGILLLCVMPSMLLHWNQQETANRVHWSFWLAMIPLITVSKVSGGAIWFGLVGYTAARTFGLQNLRTWTIAGVALILFAAALWLASDPAGMGGRWFGTPYYVERAWDNNDYLMPMRIQLEWLGALAGLWMLTRHRHAQASRRIWEPMLVVAVGANLPGLLMQIPGGDAYYFITVSNWLALPVLIGACAVLQGRVGKARTSQRWIKRGLVLALAVAAIWPSVPEVRLGLRHFVAGSALLRSGDLSFYDNDNKRPVREDAERAWDILDHKTLLSGPRAVAPADGLLAKLIELRGERGNTAALYVSPGVADYWNYLRDCDLAATFPMAMAGVQMIDGYNPDQRVCRQEISRRGYPDVPERRVSKNDTELCALAQERRINAIYVIESLTDRSHDRLLAC